MLSGKKKGKVENRAKCANFAKKIRKKKGKEGKAKLILVASMRGGKIEGRR